MKYHYHSPMKFLKIFFLVCTCITEKAQDWAYSLWITFWITFPNHSYLYYGPYLSFIPKIYMKLRAQQQELYSVIYIKKEFFSDIVIIVVHQSNMHYKEDFVFILRKFNQMCSFPSFLMIQTVTISGVRI